MPQTPLPEFLTKQEVAKRLRISVRHLENQINSRALSVLRIGRRVVIDVQELIRFQETFTVKSH